ncbi:MAG: hypothetical protein ABI471_09825 [Sphingomonas bacterium]
METLKRRWPMVFGALITVAMIIGLSRELLGSGLVGLSRAVPHNPLFYVAFVLLYMSSPAGDYIIFRRLWGIPLSGQAALLKKRIANDVVLGYSGEAYFYAWARQNAKMVAAPFGAVKDVSILSAIAGNMITLAMVALALPFGVEMLSPAQLHTVETSAVITFAMSLPFLIFSKRVFSLPRAKLWWIFAVHCARVISGSVFIAFAWHFALPAVSIGMWLILAAARSLVSRLPLVPNKDLLFANFTILLIGENAALSELMAMTAALVLLVHIVLIGSFSLYGLLRTKNEIA